MDEETFLRFIRWTYNSDYPAREHTTIEPEEAIEEPEKHPVADDDMYVFAEKYDIQFLKRLALQKLQHPHQLAIHTLYIERVGEITTLLEYVYASTMAPITTIHEEDGIMRC